MFSLGLNIIHNMRIQTSLNTALATLLVLGSAVAQEAPKVIYVPAQEVESSIRKAPEQRPTISWIDYADTAKYLASVIRRTAPDKAEVHEGMTDVWYVIVGSGTLVTGGSLTEPARTEPDELRGTGIAGGETRHVTKGDILVIPTGIPHWLSKIDGEIIYLVVKASTK